MSDDLPVKLPSDALPGAVPNKELNKLVILAREVATGIFDLDTILGRHGLTPQQYEVIVKNEFFARVLEAETLAWQSARNTPERVRIEAAAALEAWLPTLHARIHDDNELLPATIEGGKLLARLAGIGEKSDTAGGGEKVSISINMGAGGEIKVEKVIDHQTEAPPVGDK